MNNIINNPNSHSPVFTKPLQDHFIIHALIGLRVILTPSWATFDLAGEHISFLTPSREIFDLAGEHISFRTALPPSNLVKGSGILTVARDGESITCFVNGHEKFILDESGNFMNSKGNQLIVRMHDPITGQPLSNGDPKKALLSLDTCDSFTFIWTRINEILASPDLDSTNVAKNWKFAIFVPENDQYGYSQNKAARISTEITFSLDSEDKLVQIGGRSIGVGADMTPGQSEPIDISWSNGEKIDLSYSLPSPVKPQMIDSTTDQDGNGKTVKYKRVPLALFDVDSQETETLVDAKKEEAP